MYTTTFRRLPSVNSPGCRGLVFCRPFMWPLQLLTTTAMRAKDFRLASKSQLNVRMYLQVQDAHFDSAPAVQLSTAKSWPFHNTTFNDIRGWPHRLTLKTQTNQCQWNANFDSFNHLLRHITSDRRKNDDDGVIAHGTINGPVIAPVRGIQRFLVPETSDCNTVLIAAKCRRYHSMNSFHVLNGVYSYDSVSTPSWFRPPNLAP